MSERLHKILAQHGLGSRRELESWIQAGRVELNGRPASVGDRYSPGDRVFLDGKEVTHRLTRPTSVQVLVYHKPQGQSLSRDEREQEEGEPTETVLERLPAVRGSRWVPINPMHAGDDGLLLVTNDGNLSYALTRQKRSIPTAYMVRVHAPRDPSSAPQLPLALNYDGEAIEFTKIEPSAGEGSNLWYRVELARADRRAAVRALFESHGLKISRMTQVQFADIDLPRDLPRGRQRALSAQQVASLFSAAQLPPPVPAAPQNVARRAPARRGGGRPARSQPARKR